MFKIIKRCCFLFGIYCFAFGFVSAQVGEKEPVLKAAFIYNFTKYIDWNSGNAEEFTIGIIGNSSIYEPLNEIASTKMAGNKKIVIRRFNTPDEITDCNILFIPSDNPYSIFSILSHTTKGMLTISETPGYAKMGTCINFVVNKDKLKFEANVKSIFDAGLKASSQLLKLAILVG